MSVHPFDQLPQVLEKYRAQLTKVATVCAQKAATAGGGYLVEQTPVDTGKARSNWVLSVDSPFAGILPAYFPYPKTHHYVGEGAGYRKATKAEVLASGHTREEGANLVAALAQHFLAVQAFDVSRNNAIYVTNNVDYVARLNEGYSKQSEPGWFERSPGIAVKAVAGHWTFESIA